MNFDLSDEQKALREAARDALTRTNLIAEAHKILDGEEGPDLWPAAREAGWPGLLISEEHGGAGLGAVDALLVAIECGRVLAGVPILGHVLATSVLDAAADAVGAERLTAFAEGDERVAFVGSMPPGDLDDGWTADPVSGMVRPPAPSAEVDGSEATVTGTVAWVPDAPGADALVVLATTGDGAIAVLIDGDADGVEHEPITRYDVTRKIGHVKLDGAKGTVLDVGDDVLKAAWNLGQAWLGAESLGSVETAMDVSLAYAKERFTFGRAIGSYQAVKHSIVEMLRQGENTRSLVYYAGWAYHDMPSEFALAANAARTAGGHALDFTARAQINVHGGIGATWEHDAPLYFRRAQLSRRLLGGAGAAVDRVAGELMLASIEA
jgi:alkylation response protein AidB-like acyl-CoA dehydrogenase